MTLNATPDIVHLDSLAVLRLRGADALSFLQGQLSSDVERLRGERTLLAGLHNPQGRVIAILRLIALAPDDVLALLPTELANDVLTRLRKYVLRAKVKLEDDSAQWRIEGGWGVTPGAVASVPIAGDRYIAMRGAATDTVQPNHTAHWRAADIAAGLPQVVRATSESFIGQMLNLDLVDAISFTKGCYTGQEVIARAHYRGRVKRRMQRFVSAAVVTLPPGEQLVLTDGRSARVVDSVQRADGRCEFLAVAPLSVAEPAEQQTGSSTPIECESLSLPYEFPD